MRIILIALITAILTGCGPFVPVETIDKAGIKTVLEASKIPIVSLEEASTMQVLGEVSGYSCMNKSTEVKATETGAIDQAKIVAIQRGATAITNLNCKEGGVSLLKNCWHYWECKATALGD